MGWNRDVGCAGGEQLLLHVAVDLRVHVVDVRLDEQHRRPRWLDGVPDPEPQHVRPALRVAAARAVADRRYVHCRPLERRQRAGDRGTGRRHHLHRPVAGARRQRRARHRDQLQRGGRGHRQRAVRRTRRAAAGRQRRTVQPLDAKQPQSYDAAHDVDDRIERADLVEVDLVFGHAVDARLSGGQQPEHRRRSLPVVVRQRRCLDQRKHVGQAPVRLRRFGEVDVRLRGGEPGAPHALRPQRPAGRLELRQLVVQRRGIDAGVDERTEQHVAADAGETVQVCDARHAVTLRGNPSRTGGGRWSELRHSRSQPRGRQARVRRIIASRRTPPPRGRQPWNASRARS